MIIHLQTHIGGFAGNFHSYNPHSLIWAVSGLPAAVDDGRKFVPIKDAQLITSSGLTVTETLIEDPVNSN